MTSYAAKGREHVLKCWPEPFAAIRDGRKRFEVRVDDRGFAVGDVLVLHEWQPDSGPLAGGEYTSSKPLRMRVTYLLRGGRFELDAQVCVMSLEPVEGTL